MVGPAPTQAGPPARIPSRTVETGPRGTDVQQVSSSGSAAARLSAMRGHGCRPSIDFGWAAGRCGCLSAATRNAARGTAFDPLGRRLALQRNVTSRTVLRHFTFPTTSPFLAFPHLQIPLAPVQKCNPRAGGGQKAAGCRKHLWGRSLRATKRQAATGAAAHVPTLVADEMCHTVQPWPSRFRIAFGAR